MKTLRLIALLLAPVAALAGGLSMTLDELVANRSAWPTEVKVTSSARGTIIKGGKPAGAMLVGAGSVLGVTEITAETVTGRLGSNLISVPIGKTDLMRRADGGAPVPAVETPAETAPSAPAAAAPSTGQSTAMSRLLSGKLVKYSGGKLVNVDAAALGGVKYYALYYSASWCGPCRQFTPGFVQAYQKLKAEHPEFEAVFLSGDRSAGDMLEYMRNDKMAWPAVKYDQRNDQMMRYSGPGIPCLVLVDANGKVLADSFVNGNYVGPQQVLEQTKRILKKG